MMLASTAETLNQLLDEEFEAIVAHDGDRLGAISQQKAEIVAALEAIGNSREEFTRDEQAALQECQRRNQRNGTVLNMRRRHADTVLRIMHAIPDNGAVYDASGRTHALTTTRYNVRA